MIYFRSAILLLSGIGIFLFGMRIMSQSLEKLINSRVSKLISKLSKNPLAGVMTGATATALVHSSAAVTTITAGFVNMGVLTVLQSTYIIMGANIGTTVTGLLIALSSFDFSFLFLLPSFVGMIIYSAAKKEKTKLIGYSLCGLGLIFSGLSTMSSAINAVSQQAFFIRMFSRSGNPILLMIIGALVCAIVQSSTAVNGLVITLVGVSGGLNITDAVFIILGTNVGTCVTSIIGSSGMNTAAKQSAIIHLLFNVLGTVVFMVVFLCISMEKTALFLNIFGKNAEFQIAYFNIFQNIVCTIIFLPFAKLFVKFSQRLSTKFFKPKKQLSKKF